MELESPAGVRTLPEHWLLRWRKRGGGWGKGRATTEQIRHAVLTGRLSLRAEARRPGESDFLVLAKIPEFDKTRPASPPGARRKRSTTAKAVDLATSVSRWRRLVLGIGAALVVVAGSLAVYLSL
jgi:hypothetical protein